MLPASSLGIKVVCDVCDRLWPIASRMRKTPIWYINLLEMRALVIKLQNTNNGSRSCPTRAFWSSRILPSQKHQIHGVYKPQHSFHAYQFYFKPNNDVHLVLLLFVHFWFARKTKLVLDEEEFKQATISSGRIVPVEGNPN